VSCLLLLISTVSATWRRHPYRHPPREALQNIQITTSDAGKDGGGGKGHVMESRIIGGEYPSEEEPWFRYVSVRCYMRRVAFIACRVLVPFFEFVLFLAHGPIPQPLSHRPTPILPPQHNTP
jgi:hypothetical protein